MQLRLFLKPCGGMGSPVQGDPSMMKVFVLAVIGAACSSVAFAGEVKQTKIVAPVVKATTMSDTQMDKVTAGDAGGNPNLGHDNTSGNPMGLGIGAEGKSGRTIANGNGRFGSP
jgi:hypothetical protein